MIRGQTIGYMAWLSSEHYQNRPITFCPGHCHERHDLVPGIFLEEVETPGGDRRYKILNYIGKIEVVTKVYTSIYAR